MTRKRRRFTAEFKKRVALEALREHDTVQAIASRYEVHPNQVSAWKRQAVEGLEEVFSGPGSKRGGEHEATIRDLHAKIGELTVECKRCADPTFPWMSRLKLDTRLVDRRVCGCRMGFEGCCSSSRSARPTSVSA